MKMDADVLLKSSWRAAMACKPCCNTDVSRCSWMKTLIPTCECMNRTPWVGEPATVVQLSTVVDANGTHRVVNSTMKWWQLRKRRWWGSKVSHLTFRLTLSCILK